MKMVFQYLLLKLFACFQNYFKSATIKTYRAQFACSGINISMNLITKQGRVPFFRLSLVFYLYTWCYNKRDELKCNNLKEKEGRGLNRAAWVNSLDFEFRSEFDRLRKLGDIQTSRTPTSFNLYPFQHGDGFLQ